MPKKIFDYEKAKELDSLLHLAQENLAQMVKEKEFKKYLQNLLKGDAVYLVSARPGLSLSLYLRAKDQKPTLSLKHRSKFAITPLNFLYLQTFFQEERKDGLWEIEEVLKKLVSSVKTTKFFREKFKSKRQ